MSVFSRHVDGVVAALSWRRTVVVEQGIWEPRRSEWKPHGDNVRSVRTVYDQELREVLDPRAPGAGAVLGPPPKELKTIRAYEYEELSWHKYRSFHASGDSTADVRWPEYTLGPDQRVSERRETYRAKFSVDTDGEAEYRTELDQATWRTLKLGLRCRLKVGAHSREVEHVAPAPD